MSIQPFLSVKSFCHKTNRHVVNVTVPFIPGTPIFYTPVVTGLGEGARQKILIRQVLTGVLYFGSDMRDSLSSYLPYPDSQLVDLFHTTHEVKTQLVNSRGHHCGDIDLARYLVKVKVTVSLVLDLRITHDRFGSNSDPNFNGHLHCVNDIDRSLNEVSSDKIQQYRSD
jgi:hypothetical protein